MKNLKAIAMGALLTACCLGAGAQEKKIPLNEPDRNKPRLFSDLPQKMNLELAKMQPTLLYTIGSSVSLKLSDNFLFEGTVVSRSGAQQDSIVSVVIRSSNRPGSTLTFTRATHADGSFHYQGRIISPNNGDAYIITGDKGKYSLEKTNLYDLMSE